MVTQLQIARQAGVTQATVSRVLSGNGSVDGQTRRRVMRIARQLHYQPFHQNDARRLVAKRHGLRVRTNVVAVFFHGSDLAFHDPWLAHLLEGAEAVLSRANQQLLLVKLRGARPPGNVREGQIDGAVAVCPEGDWRQHLQRLSVPLVGLGNEVLPVHVCPDDRAAGRLATEHLLSLGHRRIAFIGAALSHTPNVAARQAGYQDALAAAGIGMDPALIVLGGNLTTERSYAMFSSLLARGTDATGVVAYNDEMALGAVQAAVAAGLSVPEDLSVVGVDDLPWTAWVKPALTTVRLPLEQMGEAAARLLLERIGVHFGSPNGSGGAESPVCRRLGVELVVRESTGPPGAAAGQQVSKSAGQQVSKSASQQVSKSAGQQVSRLASRRVAGSCGV